MDSYPHRSFGGHHTLHRRKDARDVFCGSHHNQKGGRIYISLSYNSYNSYELSDCLGNPGFSRVRL